MGTHGILDLDIGNSRLKARLSFSEGCVQHRVVEHGSNFPGQELNTFCGNAVGAIRVSNVAGDRMANALRHWARKFAHPDPVFAIVSRRCAGVETEYADLGSDRWLVMLGGFAVAGSTCCIVDVGTAATIDLVTKNGLHAGGLVLPGLRAMARSLVMETAGVRSLPRASFGAPALHLERCVSAGALFAISGAVDRAVTWLREREGDHPKVLVTGGDGPLLAAHIAGARYHQDLVFSGIDVAMPLCAIAERQELKLYSLGDQGPTAAGISMGDRECPSFPVS